MSAAPAFGVHSAIVRLSTCQRLNTSGLSSASPLLVGSITIRRTTRRQSSFMLHQTSPADTRFSMSGSPSFLPGMVISTS
ncbi:hypothetical protein D3C71_1927990 [compost metagenome]